MNWEEVYSNIRSFAGRAASKINQTADMASLQVKLSLAQHKLEEAYAALGRASFAHFVEDKDNIDKISECITGVKDATLDVRAINAQIEEVRRRSIDSVSRVENALTEKAAEATKAAQAAQAAKKDAEERAAAVAARQAEEDEPLEIFDFEEEDFITNVSSTADAVDIVTETEE